MWGKSFSENIVWEQQAYNLDMTVILPNYKYISSLKK